MKIQNLAVIFIIIILPIAIVLEEYTKNRIQVLDLQTTYDSKLCDSTYDAMRSYQLNSFNGNTTGMLVNSKIRNINASVNTFFTSLSTNFTSLGYTKESLHNYVPALIYAMYDGYYIYSPFINTWDDQAVAYHRDNNDEVGTYNGTTVKEQNDKSKSDEILYDLKPYVFYSCRYKKGEIDVTIIYSLDNYIQIQGKINNKTVSQYGYLLDNVSYNENTDTVYYNGVEIGEEDALEENVYFDGKEEKLKYKKISGTKYYLKDGKVFSVINGKPIIQSQVKPEEIENNNCAKEYYKQAFKIRKFINDNKLYELSTSNIVMEDGNMYSDDGSKFYKINNIFDLNQNFEEETSKFNTHRIEVIKNSIERNISIAMSNFNQYSSYDFSMPKLKEGDWDKIMDNISIISFLQGINIGGKIYNGYSIITNNNNKDVVMPDSIYVETKDDNTYHKVTEENLKTRNLGKGIFNVNLEKRVEEQSNGNYYYFPVYGVLSYDSLVTQNKVIKKKITEYIKIDLNGTNLQKIYFTALGRERYGLYRPQIIINNV